MSESADLECPFCRLPPERILAENRLAVAIPDCYPVTPGHTLIIARRHVSDFFELDADEVLAVWKLLTAVRRRLDAELRPEGYNVGVNVGTAAGQTIPHVHVHLIPRYSADVAEPIGGVRNVIPGRGKYPFAGLPGPDCLAFVGRVSVPAGRSESHDRESAREAFRSRPAAFDASVDVTGVRWPARAGNLVSASASPSEVAKN
ncbi:MAG: HIT family protein [Rhodopirellula sp.]|nr:HIT family protein [Rhodopirellula sp.]